MQQKYYRAANRFAGILINFAQTKFLKRHYRSDTVQNIEREWDISTYKKKKKRKE